MAKDGDLDGPELLEVAAERLEVCGPVSAPRFKELVGIDEVGAPARANAGTIGPLESEGLGVREDAVVGAALGNGGKHEAQVRFLNVGYRDGLVPEVRGPVAKDEGIVDASKVGAEEHDNGRVGLKFACDGGVETSGQAIGFEYDANEGDEFYFNLWAEGELHERFSELLRRVGTRLGEAVAAPNEEAPVGGAATARECELLVRDPNTQAAGRFVRRAKRFEGVAEAAPAHDAVVHVAGQACGAGA